MSSTNSVKQGCFISYFHINSDISTNSVSIKHNIREKGFNIRINLAKNNIMLFIVSGKIKICINGFPEHLSNSNTIIFIPRNANFDIEYVETSEVFTAEFGKLHHIYSKKLFMMLAEVRRQNHPFPCMPINGIIHEYLNDVRKFITNPLHKGYKCEVYEEEFFITFGVYYAKAELAQLFYPILDNPELIR